MFSTEGDFEPQETFGLLDWRGAMASGGGGEARNACETPCLAQDSPPPPMPVVLRLRDPEVGD